MNYSRNRGNYVMVDKCISQRMEAVSKWLDASWKISPSVFYVFS